MRIPENAPRILPVCRSMLPLVGKKHTVDRNQLFLRNLPVRAFDSRAQWFSTPLARRRSSCPPPSPNLARTHPIDQAFRDSAPCVSRATTSRRAPNWSSEEAHLVNTTLTQPYRRRISIDRLNREDSQLVNWLHLSRVGLALHPPERSSHTRTPKTRFRREKTRGGLQLFVQVVSLL